MNLALASPVRSSKITDACPAEPLTGRTGPLSALIDGIPRAGSGPGSAMMVTGPAGIGRSALLRAFCRSAVSRASVLCAGPLDGTWYDAGSSQGPPDDRPLSSHRLHRTVLDLARRGPVVLTVDDAHRYRSRSLRDLDYVLRRSTGLPLLLVITAPTLPAVDEPPALTSLLARHSWTTLELAPLAACDVAEVLAQRLGCRPEPTLLRGCLEHSEGVPAAVHTFADRHSVGYGPCHGTGPEPGGTAPAGPDLLPGPASAVLSAVAALGSADPELVSELIRMPSATARRILDHLTELRVLPLGGQEGEPWPSRALPHGISSDEVVSLYAPAARLLEDAGRPPTQAAEAPLRTQHSDAAPWMLEALYSAALDTDSPTRAVRYLSHALDIGADQDARSLRRIRARLAEVLSTTEPAVALTHLSTLLATSTDERELADLALRYANTLIMLGRADEAALLLARVLDRPADSEAVAVPDDRRAALESALLLSGTLEQGTLCWVRERSLTSADPDGDSPDNRRLRLARTALSMLSGRPAPIPKHPVLTATAPGTPLDDLSLISSAVVAHLTDDDATALDALDRILRHPARRGSDPSRTKALMVRALVLCGTGDLPAAELQCRKALEFERQRGEGADTVTPSVVFAYVLAQRGRTPAAEAVLSTVSGADLAPLFFVHPMYWWARAAVRRARDDRLGALVALRAGGRAIRPGEAASPVILPCWLEAADLLTELGRPDEARHMASRCDALTDRWNTPRSAGLSLLARGLATPGPDGHQLLDEACVQLAESRARPLWARAEYALGSALLAAGDPKAARARLRTALDLMTGCGAGEAAERIRIRLVEAGGRPRRLSCFPHGALTTRERHVAVLAMAGHSNREIADALYITRRTVELHLSNTYQKLGVSRREELVGVLRPRPVLSVPRQGGEER